MKKHLLAYTLIGLLGLSVLGCASRNDVCTNCLERTDERLLDACASLYPDAIKRILSEGASINVRDQYGDTPLMKALRQPTSHSMEKMRALEETVAILLNEGADITAINDRNQETLHLVQKTNNLNVIQIIEPKMAQSDKDKMLMRSLSDKQFEIALYLIEHGANTNLMNEKDQTPLHLALNTPTPNRDLIQKLLNLNVNAKDAYETTPIMIACAHGVPVDIVESLFNAGAEINSRYQQKNLLFLALNAEHENIPLITYLLEHGFSANEYSADGIPFIVHAAKMDRIQSVVTLAQHGADTTQLEKFNEKAYDLRLKMLQN